jgi:RNA polymerase sigma-70 factor, ECF subfamily
MSRRRVRRHSVDELRGPSRASGTQGRFVSAVNARRSGVEERAAAAAAAAGDEAAFAALAESYQQELRLHCYRMLGSFEDSEDLVQETFLRAWRKRRSFQGRSSFRAWLYRIATNACLDALERRPRVAPSTQANPSEVPWLQPYPDRLLDEIAASDDEPDAAVVAKETIELAFLVAIQHLPPRQRAVLILRDVLGWSAKETAALLEGSVAAVNSALQRARRALKRHLPPRRSDWATGSEASDKERALLQRYVDASERGDGDALVELLREDARFTMPPEPTVVVGGEAIVTFWIENGFGSDSFGHMRCVLTRANRQPAVACYLRPPAGSDYRPLSLDVLRIEDGALAEVTTFGSEVFPAFGLPSTL